jgi:hypothetical protein
MGVGNDGGVCVVERDGPTPLPDRSAPHDRPPRIRPPPNTHTHTHTQPPPKQLHPRLAALLNDKLLPLHPSLPRLFHKTLTTPSIHLTPHHLLPATAALGLVALWTAGSCVPERWSKHGTSPAWLVEGGAEEEEEEEEGEGGEWGRRRTLVGEVGRLLRGDASMGEAFEVAYRGLLPVLSRRREQLMAAGAAVGGGGGGGAGGGLRRGL